MEETRDIGVARLGNYYGYDGGTYAGNVYDSGGICPTLKTAQGGGRQPMTVDIKQATKEGYIPCEVGGGMRSELSRQQNKARPSAGKRTDMPDSDNGEYP